MQKIFLYDNVNNRIELNVPEILLTREFKALMDKKEILLPRIKKENLELKHLKNLHIYGWH